MRDPCPERDLPWWRDPDAMFLASFILAVILGVLSTPAAAVLTIEICGSSTVDCKTPEASSQAQAGCWWSCGTELGTVIVTDGSDRAEVQVNNAAPFPAPPGWTQSTTLGDPYPVPPSTAPPLTEYRINLAGSDSGWQPSLEAACAAWVSGRGAGYVNPTVVGGQCYYGYLPNWPDGSPNAGPVAHVTATGCPSGYTSAGGSCTLSDAEAVDQPSDGRCPVARVGDVYTTDERDPDCADSTSTTAGKVNLSVSGSTVNAGISHGQTVTISTAGDGTTTVVVRQPSGGDTVVWTAKTGAPDGNGVSKVGGTAVATSAGTGSMNDPESTQSNCGGPGQPQCTVRVNEAGTPSGDGAFTSAGSALDEAAEAFTDKLAALAGEEKVTDLGLSFGTWLPVSADCAPWTFAFHTWEQEVDWCGYLGRIREIWGWVFAVLLALYMWRSATSAPALGGK